MSATNGEGDRRAEGIILFSSFIKIGERHRDIKPHSNNKVIINFGKPYYASQHKSLHHKDTVNIEEETSHLKNNMKTNQSIR